MIHTLKLQDFLSLNSEFEFSRINIIKSDNHQGILLMKLLYTLQWHISTPHEQAPAKTLYDNLIKLLDLDVISYQFECNGRLVTPYAVDILKANELEPVYLDLTHTMYTEHKELVSMDDIEYSCYGTCLCHIYNTLLKGKIIKGKLLKEDMHTPLSWLTYQDRTLSTLSEIIKQGSLWRKGVFLWNDPRHSDLKTLARLIESISIQNQVFILTTNYELIYNIISPLKKDEYQLIDL